MCFSTYKLFHHRRSQSWNRCADHDSRDITLAVFRNSLPVPVLKTYNICDMNYSFPVLAVNFRTQPLDIFLCTCVTCTQKHDRIFLDFYLQLYTIDSDYILFLLDARQLISVSQKSVLEVFIYVRKMDIFKTSNYKHILDV